MVMWNLPKGGAFLPNVSVEEIRALYAQEKKAKPKVRLLCAIHRKEGKSIDDIVGFTGVKRRTVHETLKRFVKRGIDAKDAIKPRGRPPKLTEKQRRKLVERLERGPPYNETGLWTTKEVREFIRKEFGVEYRHSYVWELLTAAGFSIQKPRPRNYKAPSKREARRFKKKLLCWQGITGKKVS